jgi:hypothetical protein
VEDVGVVGQGDTESVDQAVLRESLTVAPRRPVVLAVDGHPQAARLVAASLR